MFDEIRARIDSMRETIQQDVSTVWEISQDVIPGLWLANEIHEEVQERVTELNEWLGDASAQPEAGQDSGGSVVGEATGLATERVREAAEAGTQKILDAYVDASQYVEDFLAWAEDQQQAASDETSADQGTPSEAAEAAGPEAEPGDAQPEAAADVAGSGSADDGGSVVYNVESGGQVVNITNVDSGNGSAAVATRLDALEARLDQLQGLLELQTELLQHPSDEAALQMENYERLADDYTRQSVETADPLRAEAADDVSALEARMQRLEDLLDDTSWMQRSEEEEVDDIIHNIGEHDVDDGTAFGGPPDADTVAHEAAHTEQDSGAEPVDPASREAAPDAESRQMASEALPHLMDLNARVSRESGEPSAPPGVVSAASVATTVATSAAAAQEEIDTTQAEADLRSQEARDEAEAEGDAGEAAATQAAGDAEQARSRLEEEQEEREAEAEEVEQEAEAEVVETEAAESDAAANPELQPTDSTSDFEVEVAALSDEAQAEVADVVEAAEATDTTGTLDVDDVMESAELAADRTERADETLHEQQDAVDEGDYATARDLAEQAEGDRAQAAEATEPWIGRLDDEREVEVQAASDDVAALDAADWAQESADETADAAADYAEAGDYEVATELDDEAESDDAAAEAYADDTDDDGYDDSTRYDDTTDG